MKNRKTKKCSICESEFYPFLSTDKYCSHHCFNIFLSSRANEDKRQDEKIKSKDKQQKNKQIKQVSDKPKKNLIRKCQSVINKYAKNRDMGKPCISCGCAYDKSFQAGHFISVGSCKFLRFNLDNIHGQCVECNMVKGGNVKRYRENLIKKIGIERVKALENSKRNIANFTISDLKELIKKHK